jgi:large subunit ribosomal protein L29
MAKNKLDILNLSIDELTSKLTELEKEQSRMTFDHGVKGIENPLQIRGKRRDIARIQTELRSRELASLSPADLAKRDRIILRRK